MNNHYIIPIFVSHKGCPHNCIFCNQKKITGINDDITEEYVLKTIDSYLSTMDRKHSYIELSFYGGSFTGIPIDKQNELLNAAKKALDDGRINNIRLSTRPDYIDESILSNLKKYGVGIIELGAQSMDEQVLRISERGHTSYDVINASNLIKKMGFKLGLQMMIGLPEDTKNKDLETAKALVKLCPDFVRIYPALVVKDTYMELMYNNFSYKPLSVDDAVDICKEIYYIFTINNIHIIRIGLQPTEQINLGKDVVAGPFHPAFREIVESSILNDMINFMINEYFYKENNVYVNVSPKYISKLYADKKKNFNNMIKRNLTKKIIVRQDDTLNAMVVCLYNDSIKKIMSVFDYIKLTKKEGFSLKL